MASYPTVHDKEFDLWRKIAANWYEIAVAGGHSPTPLSARESLFSLQQKVAYYTYLLAS